MEKTSIIPARDPKQCVVGQKDTAGLAVVMMTMMMMMMVMMKMVMKMVMVI